MHKSSLKPDLTERPDSLAEKQNIEPSSNQGATVAFRHAEGTKQMRTLVFIGIAFLVQFFWWFADSNHIGYAPLFWLLTFSLCYKMLRMLHEWYHYVDVLEPIAPLPSSTTPRWTVDMLTTACPGEPYGMIIRTLESIVAVRHPHTTYLCDEGDDPFLRAECSRLGVIHVTRIEKKNAKAGNVNNALRQATGELCVVLDPDHEVTPDFLDQVLPYFEDTTVGYVQVVQAYGNQKDSFVALGAAEQTYHFYGPLMMGMNSYNTVQAIGANCTFRRTALDSIGGHAAGLTEDMHTAMRMHAAGWKSIYAPVVVSRGLVPSTLGAFYSQQLKWSRGTFDLLFHVYPRLFKQLTWRQRLHYLTVPLYFFSGVVALIDIVVPIASLLLLQFPWHLSLPQFALHMLPVTIIGLLIRYHAQHWLREPHEPGLHLAGGFLRIATWWVYSLGLVYTILNVKVPYIPTPKEGKIKNEWLLCIPNLFLAFLCIAAAISSLTVQGVRGPYTKLMATLALINATILLLSVLMAQHALLNNLRSFLWTTPVLHNIKKWVDDMLDSGSGIINKSLRSGSITFAAGLAVFNILASVGVVLVQWHEQVAVSDNYIWTHSGFGPLKVGPPEISKLSLNNTSHSLITWAKSPSATSQVVELRIPSSGPLKVPVGAIEKLNQQGNIPILTWNVDEKSLENSLFQKQVTQLIARNNHLMLRPIIQAKTPKTYREAWQHLVKSYRASGDTTSVWVWTPPQTDSIAAYFPGSIYVTWIASNCETAGASKITSLIDCYAILRRQVAIQIEMQSKPMLLLVPQVPSFEPYRWALQVAERYPEIKAVVFTSSKRSTK